jgi:hypothetical protein
MKISVENLARKAKVYFTLDGTEPTPQGPEFRPFKVELTTTVKVVAVDRYGNRSPVVTGTFRHNPFNRKLTLLSSYSSQYSGGGDSALIDGLRGSTNWTGGAWQGYWEKDLVAIVDLGKVQSVSKVGAGFLQDVGSWIWLPRRVEIELSLDGKSFTPVASIEAGQTAEPIKDFVQTITPQNARFIRLRAINSGKNTWIFADEILIQN